MAVPTKLQNYDEIVRWYKQGKTYAWMVEQYKKKYNIDVSPSAIATWLTNPELGPGVERRQVRDPGLIPWEVKREHRYDHINNMLRYEARRRAGADIAPATLKRLESWLKKLEENNAVVHYDPNTEQGWWYVEREPGDDDIIRKPPHPTRPRGVRE